MIAMIEKPNEIPITLVESHLDHPEWQRHICPPQRLNMMVGTGHSNRKGRQHFHNHVEVI